MTMRISFASRFMGRRAVALLICATASALSCGSSGPEQQPDDYEVSGIDVPSEQDVQSDVVLHDAVSLPPAIRIHPSPKRLHFDYWLGPQAEPKYIEHWSDATQGVAQVAFDINDPAEFVYIYLQGPAARHAPDRSGVFSTVVPVEGRVQITVDVPVSTGIGYLTVATAPQLPSAPTWDYWNIEGDTATIPVLAIRRLCEVDADCDDGHPATLNFCRTKRCGHIGLIDPQGAADCRWSDYWRESSEVFCMHYFKKPHALYVFLVQTSTCFARFGGDFEVLYECESGAKTISEILSAPFSSWIHAEGGARLGEFFLKCPNHKDPEFLLRKTQSAQEMEDCKEWGQGACVVRCDDGADRGLGKTGSCCGL